MKGKHAIVFTLAMAMLPQTAGALSVSYSDPQSSRAAQVSQAVQLDYARVYNHRWATRPLSNSQDSRPDNGSGSLDGGGVQTPPNNEGGSLGGGLVPNNAGTSLADRLSTRPSNEGSSLGGGRMPEGSYSGISISYANGSSSQGRPDNGGGSLGTGAPNNSGSSLGGGLMPNNAGTSLADRLSTRPSNEGNSLGGGRMPNNSGSSLADTSTPPNNSGSSLGGGRMPEGSYSGITVTYADGSSSSSRPDNSGSSLGGGRMPSTRPDNTGSSLGGGKMPDNSGPSLAGALGSNSSNGRPDNSGSSLGSSNSSGSSTRPDNSGSSLASQLEENPYPGARPDNSGPSLQDQLDDQNDNNNDNNSDNDDVYHYHDYYRESNLCDGRQYPHDIDGHWSEIYVRRLYDLCVVEGYLDGLFHPNAYVTRAELVKMGLFANGIAPNGRCYDRDCGTPFNDLDEWQSQWVQPAWERNVIQGYGYNEFRPNQAITRAEAVKIVLATYGYSPINTSESFFNDVSGWSTGWIERARIIGLVQGIGNGNFDPNRPITRAEAAKIIAKMIEHWATNVSYDNQYRG